MGEGDSTKRTHTYGSPEEPDAQTPPTPGHERSTRLFGSRDEINSDQVRHQRASPHASTELDPLGWVEPRNDDSMPLLPVEEPNRDRSRTEMSRAVRLAVARCGIEGQVRLEGDHFVLETPRGTTRVSARLHLIRWDRQNAQARKENAVQVARELGQRVRSSPPPTQASGFRLDGPTLRLAGVGLVVAVAAYFGLSAELKPAPQPPAEDKAQPLSAAVSALEAQKTCETTRTRVFRGGQISMADAEGWVVEVSMLGAEGAPSQLSNPAFDEFFGPLDGGETTYTWKEEPALAFTPQSQPPVRVRSYALNDDETPRPGLTLTFSGSFVENYFDELGREKYFRLAHALTQAFRPEFAALYARCGHDQIHTLGSWFMGRSGSEAASSLLYYLGLYARPRHIDAIHYLDPRGDAPNLGRALSAIRRGTTHLDRAALSTLVGSEGGMAVGGDEAPVIVTFPFRDGNRGSRVSRTIARVTSLSQQ